MVLEENFVKAQQKVLGESFQAALRTRVGMGVILQGALLLVLVGLNSLVVLLRVAEVNSPVALMIQAEVNVQVALMMGMEVNFGAGWMAVEVNAVEDWMNLLGVEEDVQVALMGVAEVNLGASWMAVEMNLVEA